MWPASPNGRLNAGAAVIFFGNSTGIATVVTLNLTSSVSTGYIIQGAAAGDKLGYSVSGAGDINKDGYDDVIVGASKASPILLYAQPTPVSTFGWAYVIFGMASGFTTLDLAGFTSSDSTGYIIRGAAVGDNLGHSVSGAGMY
jgi:lipoprotein-anchoring transpeptidase ErfK/SrfK